MRTVAAGSEGGAAREHAVTARQAAPPRSSANPRLRLRGRPVMALVLTPEPPLTEWLEQLRAHLDRSPGFFAERPVVLDLSALPPQRSALERLARAAAEHRMRVVGVESAEPAWIEVTVPGLPAVTAPGRGSRSLESDGDGQPSPTGGPRATALLLDEPVRSGQSVVFPGGDVTIVGSVASGAEVIAGGSIHVYGALRGRAVAGSMGNPAARIFCRRLEAELLAIDGLYKTADTMDPDLRGRAVQAWLDGETMRLAPMD